MAPYPLQRRLRHRARRLELTRYETNPARPLDEVDGGAKRCLCRSLRVAPGLAGAVEVIEIDGFAGFKNATEQESPRRSDGFGSFPHHLLARVSH
jgi:hypothetical protein